MSLGTVYVRVAPRPVAHDACVSSCCRQYPAACTLICKSRLRRFAAASVGWLPQEAKAPRPQHPKRSGSGGVCLALLQHEFCSTVAFHLRMLIHTRMQAGLSWQHPWAALRWFHTLLVCRAMSRVCVLLAVVAATLMPCALSHYVVNNPPARNVCNRDKRWPGSGGSGSGTPLSPPIRRSSLTHKMLLALVADPC